MAYQIPYSSIIIQIPDHTPVALPCIELRKIRLSLVKKSFKDLLEIKKRIEKARTEAIELVSIK